MAKLTDQRKVFAANVASGMPLHDSAVDAGYSPLSASQQASALMKYPEITAEIERIRSKAMATSVGSKAECLDLIWRTMQESAANGPPRDVYQGAELWLKATGQLVTKQEVVTNQTIDIEWSQPVADGDE